MRGRPKNKIKKTMVCWRLTEKEKDLLRKYLQVIRDNVKIEKEVK